jgi:hypothetical protein
MARLIYSAITSLDGYIEGTDGRLDRAGRTKRCTPSSMLTDGRCLPNGMAFFSYGVSRRTE